MGWACSYKDPLRDGRATLICVLVRQVVRMELVQDRVQRRTLVLAVLKIRILLPKCKSAEEVDMVISLLRDN
jgi:hypothetical protein